MICLSTAVVRRWCHHFASPMTFRMMSRQSTSLNRRCLAFQSRLFKIPASEGRCQSSLAADRQCKVTCTHCTCLVKFMAIAWFFCHDNSPGYLDMNPANQLSLPSNFLWGLYDSPGVLQKPTVWPSLDIIGAPYNFSMDMFHGHVSK